MHQQGELGVEEESGMCLLQQAAQGSTCRSGRTRRGDDLLAQETSGSAQRGSLSSQASHHPSFLFILAPSRGMCLHTRGSRSTVRTPTHGVWSRGEAKPQRNSSLLQPPSLFASAQAAIIPLDLWELERWVLQRDWRLGGPGGKPGGSCSGFGDFS